MMKILLLLIFFFLNGQVLIADENNKQELLDKIESCGVLYSTPIHVKQCRLVPDTGALLKCGEYFRGIAPKQEQRSLQAEYRDNASKSEAKAQEAWSKGEKIMLAKKTPNSVKQICGYYLNCLKTYVESLPMFAPDGRVLQHESLDVKQRYNEIRAFCANGIYTLTVGIKKVEEKSPSFKRWKGKNAPRLSRITIKESKQVIFINPEGGEILNVPLPDSASSDRTSQKYVLDSHKCLFELKEEDEKNKHINTAPVYVFSTDGKGRHQRDMKFTNKTDLNFKISSIEPIIQINWKDIEKFEPTFHKASTYIAKNVLLNEQVFDVPQELRQVITVENLVAARTLLNPFKSIDSKELCGMQMGVEFLHGTVIWRQAEKIAYDYDIDFRPANKSEIAKANKIVRRMKNWSGSHTEEKGIYDSLNHPFHTPKYTREKRESYSSKEEATGILDVIVERSNSNDGPDASEKIYNDSVKEISIDDLKMFTK